MLKKPGKSGIFAILLIAMAITNCFASGKRECRILPGERGSQSLNGRWECAITGSNPGSPPDSGYEPLEVPALRFSSAVKGRAAAWYRRPFASPSGWQRVFLRLNGARFNPCVYIDGRLITRFTGGFSPFETEVTDFISPGKTHTLTIRVEDWAATFSQGYTLPGGSTEELLNLRSVPKGKIIAPIGGHFALFGIWDSVELKGTPSVYLDDVVISTSVRKGTLAVRGRVKCDLAKRAEGEGRGDEHAPWSSGGLMVRAEVLDGAKSVLNAGIKAVDHQGSFAIEAAFPNPSLWSPENPNLYRLSLSLVSESDGFVSDNYEERFGFREIWASGPDLYVNGIKRHFLATSTWPGRFFQNDEEIREAILGIKGSGAIAFRLHTQPWQKRWIELADEAGLFIIVEGALWCDGGGSYAYEDERFWANYMAHLEGMVLRDINNPSVVMWSLENEILHCGAARYNADVEKRLAACGRMVAELDPTRLITFEADLDPGGIADVIGLHYPHEMPEYSDFPNTANWLSHSVMTGEGGGLLGSRGENFMWKRDKPLYIGEYLWVPYDDASPGSVYFGDEAYSDLAKYKTRAKARAWIDQTIAYRVAGVSGICPWTCIEEGGYSDPESEVYLAQKEAYSKVAAFPVERNERFYAGDTVARTFDVLNDTSGNLELDLKYAIPTLGYSETRRLSVEAAGISRISLSVKIPRNMKTKDHGARVSLLSGGSELYAKESRFRVFARYDLPVPANTACYVYDPSGSIITSLKGERIKNLGKLEDAVSLDPERSIVLVGASAFGSGETGDDKAVIAGSTFADRGFFEYLTRGGKAILLEQDTYGRLPLGLTLSNKASTMSFVSDSMHPVFGGMEQSDLVFWGSDNYVSRKEIVRPNAHGIKMLAVSGGVHALDTGTIAEVQYGKGRLIAFEALIAEKYESEPACRTLLANAVLYLLAKKSSNGKTILVTDDPNSSFVSACKKIGLDADINGAGHGADGLFDASCILLDSGGERVNVSLAAISGAKGLFGKSVSVYWHSPDPGLFEEYAERLGFAGFTVEENQSPLAVFESACPLFDGILREDLAFGSTTSSAASFRIFEYDDGIVDRFLAPEARVGGESYEAETWDMEGHLVNNTDKKNGVSFYTNGSITGRIRVKTKGLYSAGVLASGTSALGVFPRCEIAVDGSVAVRLTLDSEKLKEYRATVHLKEGTSEIKIAFANDLFAGNEDRNLFIDRVSIHSAADTGVSFLTLPPAVAASECGPGLNLVIDCVLWDKNQKNAAKGLRFANTLLANLGARFSIPKSEPEWISHMLFNPVGTIALFSKKESASSFITNGKVSASISFESDGEYSIFVRGYSTSLEGTFGKAEIFIDGDKAGEAFLSSSSRSTFMAGNAHIKKGVHEITVAYTNDKYKPPEDRNLYFMGIGFLKL